MFLLCSNVDTIVLGNLNNYDRKQLPCLSLHERLTSPACVVLQASDILASLQCWYSTDIFKPGMTENSYWDSRFARSSVVQLASAMVTFLLCSNVDSILVREAHTRWPWKAQPSPKCEAHSALQHWMHLHDKPCLLHMTLLFWPARWVRTNAHLLKNIQ